MGRSDVTQKEGEKHRAGFSRKTATNQTKQDDDQ